MQNGVDGIAGAEHQHRNGQDNVGRMLAEDRRELRAARRDNANDGERDAEPKAYSGVDCDSSLLLARDSLEVHRIGTALVVAAP